MKTTAHTEAPLVDFKFACRVAFGGSMKFASQISLLALIAVAGCNTDDTPSVDPVDPTLVERVVDALSGEDAISGMDLLH